MRWEFGANANAAAKWGKKGDAAGGGTKYRQNDELNGKPVRKNLINKLKYM